MAEQALRIYFDTPYRYTVNGKRGWRYKPLFLALHCHTGQYQVVYEGLDGPDRGKRFTCTLADWDLKFAVVEPPATATKQAGHQSESLGV